MVHFVSGFTIGFFISIPWLAVLFAGQRLAGFPLIPFELFEFISQSLPGSVVSLGIEYLIKFVNFLGVGQTSSTGKLLEIATAYIMSLVLLSGFAGLYAVTLQRWNISWIVRGLVASFLLSAGSLFLVIWGGWRGTNLLLNFGWLILTSFGWGIATAWLIDRFQDSIEGRTDISRRRVLIKLGTGSLVLSGAAIGLSRWLHQPVQPAGDAQGSVLSEENFPPLTLPPANAGFQPVPGTRPEITPMDEFYRVDINLLPPGDEEFLDSSDPLVQRLLAQGGETELPEDTYKLIVDGLVDNPLSLSLADLKTFPQYEQFATLQCISNPIAGDLISTTIFTGARLKDILEIAGLKSPVIDIKFTSVDGYSESLPVQIALDPETLLCYSMGNQPLSESHGSPIRLYTPNRYGIKNPKWMIKIEAIDTDYKGFWQKRGWSESGIIKTTAVIDTIQIEANNQVLVGGMAFAGSRGIQAVELRADDGEWNPAELDRALSSLAWVIWRAELNLPPGEHELTVRAIDGKGEIQTERNSNTHPNGATGYHSKTFTI